MIKWGRNIDEPDQRRPPPSQEVHAQIDALRKIAEQLERCANALENLSEKIPVSSAPHLRIG